MSMVAVLAASCLYALPGDGLGTDWLFEEKWVRLISFEVRTEAVGVGARDIFIPAHQSGFITLRKDTFTISNASAFNTMVFNYEDGSLQRSFAGDTLLQSSFAGDTWDRTKKPMEFRAALAISVDECISPGLNDILEAVRLRSREAKPKGPIQLAPGVTAEFEGSWGALKRIVRLKRDLGKSELSIRTTCEFKVILPTK